MTIKRNTIKPMQRIHRPSGQDRIPGSTKRRTFVANGSVYSHESDLEKITNKQYRACGANLNKKGLGKHE